MSALLYTSKPVLFVVSSSNCVTFLSNLLHDLCNHMLIKNNSFYLLLVTWAKRLTLFFSKSKYNNFFSIILIYLLFLAKNSLMDKIMSFEKTKCIPCKLFAQPRLFSSCKAFAQLLLLVKNSPIFNTIEIEGLKSSL